MTTSDLTKTYHDQARKFFEKTAQEKARETKFVQRESPINGVIFLFSLVMNVFQHGTIRLGKLAITAHKLNSKVNVSEQAIEGRYTPFAVAFVKAMFIEALKLTAPNAVQVVPLLNGFSEVNVIDSSVITLPESLEKKYPGCGGAGAKASAKVYLLLNWLTGLYQTIRIEAGRKADQNMGLEFIALGKPASLWLFDLGFFNAAFLAAIAEAGSFFLCRLAATQMNFWCCNAEGELEPFDLDRFLRYAPRELFEIDVIFGSNKKINSRLIIAPVPARVAAERRRKLREKARKNGQTPSGKTLRRCDWTLLLTNASEEQLPTSTVLEIYRVRWQVELAFKLFKSDAQLEQTNATKVERVECEFYAKLIAILLFNQLSKLAEELVGEKISPAKLWRQMRGDSEDLFKALGGRTANALIEMLEFLSRYAKPSSRKKYPSTLQRLDQAIQKARQVKMKDPLGYLREKLKTLAERIKIFAQYVERYEVTFDFERLIFQRTI